MRGSTAVRKASKLRRLTGLIRPGLSTMRAVSAAAGAAALWAWAAGLATASRAAAQMARKVVFMGIGEEGFGEESGH